MTDENKNQPAEQKSSLADELAKMECEPLLPIEKKLIVYSLIHGVGLLVVLAWVSLTFFKV